jgi:hypothetical protein
VLAAADAHTAADLHGEPVSSGGGLCRAVMDDLRAAINAGPSGSLPTPSEALAAPGAGLTDMLKSAVYVVSADPSDLFAAWDIVHAACGEHDTLSTQLGITALGYQDQLVEVEAVPLIAAQVPHSDLPSEPQRAPIYRSRAGCVRAAAMPLM